jgi:16S rRNA (guanine966-N2)-methyltransferase
LLRAPPGDATRPTGDRVREAIFNVLAGLVDMEGAEVADLFAGSGAMGIEALSRGAGTVVFVDSSLTAVRTVRANITGTGLDPDATRVVRADVLEWLLRPHRFDLVLCDPPYAFDHWPELLDRLRGEVVVIESDRPVTVPESWEIIRNKRYGGTLVTVVRSRQPHPAAEPPQRGIS